MTTADLQRFIDAQAPVWDDVLAELGAGAKRSHWMWFVFPQLASLGRSATARHYGLLDLAHAQAYAQHRVLGPRLRQCCALLVALPGDVSARQVFGDIDTLKLCSCLTLFERADPGEALYAALLQRWYGGRRDAQTLQRLGG